MANVPDVQYQVDPFTATALIMGWLVVLWQQYKEWVRTRKKKSNLTTNTDINQRVYDILRELRKEYKCLRVFLCQFRNGDNFFSGQSIQAISITHEWTHGDARGRHYQKIPIDSLSNAVISSVMKFGARKEFSWELMMPDLKKELSSFDGRTALYLRITNGKPNQMVAMLVFHWTDEECLMGDDEIRRIQNHEVKDLEDIFINAK